MNRAKHLFEKIIDHDNVRIAVMNVADSHRWRKNHKPNKIAGLLTLNADKVADEVIEMIKAGWQNSEYTEVNKYDTAAHKWRNISISSIYPDQIVHHAIIQVLKSVMMKHMDPWCLSAIEGRGTTMGVKAIQKWMRTDVKGTKYCLELDIKHFYDSIEPKYVISRFRELIKDEKTIDLLSRIIDRGVLKGVYCSQWFANTLLQPLDELIRRSGATHYIRFADNFTIFCDDRDKLIQISKIVELWLNAHELYLNTEGGGKVFEVSKRMPNALGYRYGRVITHKHGKQRVKVYTLIRKRRLITIKRQLQRFQKLHYIQFQFAAGLMSRLGGFLFCNCCNIWKRIVPNGTIRRLRQIIRHHSKKGLLEWNTYLEQLKRMEICWSH